MSETSLKSNERNEYSDIGLGYFFLFFREKSGLFTLYFDFSGFEFWFHFKFTSIHLLKGKQTPLLSTKIVKVTKNVIDF